MSRVIKCAGVTAPKGGQEFDVWVNPEQVISYSKLTGTPGFTCLWIGGGEEDYIMIKGSVEETLTRFGFNNGGG